jgi:hypothetical protein
MNLMEVKSVESAGKSSCNQKYSVDRSAVKGASQPIPPSFKSFTVTWAVKSVSDGSVVTLEYVSGLLLGNVASYVPLRARHEPRSLPQAGLAPFVKSSKNNWVAVASDATMIDAPSSHRRLDPLHCTRSDPAFWRGLEGTPSACERLAPGTDA